MSSSLTGRLELGTFLFLDSTIDSTIYDSTEFCLYYVRLLTVGRGGNRFKLVSGYLLALGHHNGDKSEGALKSIVDIPFIYLV